MRGYFPEERETISSVVHSNSVPNPNTLRDNKPPANILLFMPGKVRLFPAQFRLGRSMSDTLRSGAVTVSWRKPYGIRLVM
jgi:hypothetical protein